MEALVLIFAEIILACLMPLFALIASAIAAIFELLLLMIGIGTSRRKRKATAPSDPPRKPIIPRKAVHWVAGICATIGVLGIAGSYILFQPILRYAMDVASEKAEVSIEYTKASGSLLGGHVVLEGLEMSRAHATGLAFDLAIDRAEADVALFSLLGNEPRLVFGHVEGVTGTLTPPLPKEKTKGLPKQRRPFRADAFVVERVDLQITPRDEAPFPVVIATAHVAPFRSSLAVFDLLFRSNMDARIAGQTLIVETLKLEGDGRETRWLFEDVDAAQLKRLLPKAPLTWVERGELTIAVSDRWSFTEEFIDMDWRIATSDLAVSAPETAGRAERVLAAGLGKYVKKFGGDVDFQYRLELDPDEMAQLREGDLDGFWKKVLSGVTKGGVTKAEAKEGAEEAVDEEAPGALDRFKSLFKRDGKESNEAD